MKQSFLMLRAAQRVLTMAAVFCPPALAYAQTTQEVTGPYGMQFFVTPYLWLAGINATTKTPLARAPEVNSSVGPFQLLS